MHLTTDELITCYNALLKNGDNELAEKVNRAIDRRHARDEEAKLLSTFAFAYKTQSKLNPRALYIDMKNHVFSTTPIYTSKNKLLGRPVTEQMIDSNISTLLQRGYKRLSK